ncbi:MAG: pyrroline-5-carboxylate reductase [Rhizomicrobium sp.]
MKAPIVLIGAGRMGGALAKGWLDGGQGPVIAVEPHPAPALKKLTKLGLTIVSGIDALPKQKFRACVVALKPQVLKPEVAALAPLAAKGQLMLSIAAGINTGILQKAWGRNAHIVRAMPNTPGAIGQGITGLFAAKTAEKKDCVLAEKLLSALGQTVWVEKERLIDAVTAISGSGPAYVFALVEALTAAAIKLGLSETQAEQLARATVTGSGALLAADAKPAAELRHDVTSPHGTTEAAINVLLARGGLMPLIAATTKAAQRRSKELGAQ